MGTNNNKIMAGLEQLKETLTCCICMELSTLPVHPTCCESASSLPPACLTCVRSYLKLNESWRNRDYSKKSWNGCGCMIDPRARHQKTYKHTTQLDSIRNLLGPSICPHEECKAKCETTAELRRHLNGTSKNSDIHGNCQYAMTRCTYCDFFGVRHHVEGVHYEDYHASIICPLCMTDVPLRNAKQHYESHVTSLEYMKNELISKNIIPDI